KLGKRVIAARGEGRVVEVDVLRQRIRVSYGPGDTEVVAASAVRPLFPSGNQPAMREAELPEPPEADDIDDIPDIADIDDVVERHADAPADLDGVELELSDTSADASADPAEPADAVPDDDPSATT